MKKTFTFIMAVLLMASVFAQSPEKMSYQAVIRDASDNLVSSQAVGMQISILQGSASGTAVYVETQTPTSNANGLVSVEIGTGNIISGSFSDINWSGRDYNEYEFFIKTEIDPQGGSTYTITSISQLLSVPFALHSKTAETIRNGIENNAVIGGYPSFSYRTGRYNLVVGNHPTDVTKQGGILIVGNDTTEFDGNIPQVPLEINGTILGSTYGYGQGYTQGRLISLQRRDNSDPLGAISRRHYIGISENDILYFGSADEQASVYFDDGKIGIGVEEPKTALHLKGGGIYLETPYTIENSGIIMKTPDGAACYKITIDNNGTLKTTLVDCPQ